MNNMRWHRYCTKNENGCVEVSWLMKRTLMDILLFRVPTEQVFYMLGTCWVNKATQKLASTHEAELCWRIYGGLIAKNQHMKIFTNSTTYKNVKYESMQLVTTNAYYAYVHARYILKKRWADIGKPEVENVFGTDAKWACWHAHDVLKQRWADIGR